MNYIDILELKIPYTLDDIKINYKRLVKQYHPDINKDPKSLEKMKEINSSYDEAIKSLKKDNFSDIKQKKKQDNNSYTHNNSYSGTYTGPKNRNIHIDLPASLKEILSNSTLYASYGIENNRTATIEIKLNSDMKIGDKLVFKRKGFFENFCQPAGDLIVTIVLSNKDNDKTITESDVMITHNISYLDILIGNTTITGLDGKKIKITLTSEILDNKRLRLEGRGLKSGSKFGDLYVDLEITNLELSDSEKEALEYIRNNL